MTVMKTTTKIASVLGVAGLAISLAACSGGQSVAEACTIANETVNEANTDMQALFAESMSGEGNLNDLFAPISEALDAAQKKVTNSEVSESLKNISGDFTEMGDLLGDFDMSDVANLDATALESLDELETISEKLTESGEKLQELCGA